MKHVSSTLSAGLCALIVSTSALSQDAGQVNVFNADTSHPDLAAAINAFEQVCMPFVLHQTELTQKQNVQHRGKLMESLGFTFLSGETFSRKIIVDEQEAQIIQDKWDTEKRMLEEINKSKKTHFTLFNGKTYTTVFNGTSDQRTWAPTLIPTHFRTVNQFHGTYKLHSDPRVTANIGWNYPSQNHPGKSCSISLARTGTSLTKFATDLIAKDTDWKADADTPTTKPVSWSQCVEEGADDFEFKASHEDGTIKLSMKRSDFYEPKLCGKIAL